MEYRFGMWVNAILGIRAFRIKHPSHQAVASGEALWMEAVATMEQGRMRWKEAQALLESLVIRFPNHWAVKSNEVDDRLKIVKKKR